MMVGAIGSIVGLVAAIMMVHSVVKGIRTPAVGPKLSPTGWVYFIGFCIIAIMGMIRLGLDGGN